MIDYPVEITLLHHKERGWADYVQRYSRLGELEKAGLVELHIASLPQQNRHLAFARLPEKVRDLLFFAKPDLVICLDDGRRPVRPVFAIDATEHVAARDHWIQRFPNLVGCAQEGVPGAFVTLSDMPDRAVFTGRVDPVFYFAYDRVMEIHQTPIYIAPWPSSDGRTLDRDSVFRDLPPHNTESMKRLFNFLDRVIEAALKGQNLSDLTNERLIVDLRQELRGIAYREIPRISDFQRLSINSPDGHPLDITGLQRWLERRQLQLPQNLPDRILKRQHSIIFSPQVKVVNLEASRSALKKRIKQKGGDPYTQQPLVFDYLFCRLGITPWERDVNLVVDLSVLYFEDFAEYIRSAWETSPLKETRYNEIADKVPVYALHLTESMSLVVKNFVRLYSFAADMIVFRDGILYF